MKKLTESFVIVGDFIRLAGMEGSKASPFIKEFLCKYSSEFGTEWSLDVIYNISKMIDNGKPIDSIRTTFCNPSWKPRPNDFYSLEFVSKWYADNFSSSLVVDLANGVIQEKSIAEALCSIYDEASKKLSEVFIDEYERYAADPSNAKNDILEGFVKFGDIKDYSTSETGLVIEFNSGRILSLSDLEKSTKE